MQPTYDLSIHTTARRELDRLDGDERDRLTDVLASVARERQPTSHEAVRMLEGQPGLFRVRVGDIRAVCTLDKPRLRILSVGHRKNVYDNIDAVAERRVPA